MPGLVNSFKFSAGGGGSGFVLTLDPRLVYEYSPFNGDTVSGSTLATASGGTGPYTYAWAYVSGDTNITILSAVNPEGIFSTTGPRLYSVIRSARWQVTATDSLGATLTQSIEVELQVGGQIE